MNSHVQNLVLLVLVAILSVYLCLQHLKRERARRQAELESAAKWPGKAIDITPLKPAIDNLRRDHHLAARPPAKGTCFHRALLALARSTIAHLPFFQHNESQQRLRTRGS